MIPPKKQSLVQHQKLQKVRALSSTGVRAFNTRRPLQQLTKAVNERFEEILVAKASQHKSLRVLKKPKEDATKA